MISMLSFILLYFLVGGEINQELEKVMWIDVIAAVLLGIGVVLWKLFGE